MKVFLTGGTGLVGGRLIPQLRRRQDTVVLLSRRAGPARERYGNDCTIVEGDPMHPGPWMDAVADCDAVIHLAGENIFARRWSDDFKKMLRASRVQSTANVVQALAKQPRTAAGAPKVLVNASAIGWYGPRGDEELDESTPPGTDFLAQLCVDWEKEAAKAQDHGIRSSMVRVGVVLDKNGGALGQMLLPFKMFVGGPAGSGKQWMSWIHHEDLVGIILLALENPGASGPINGTAPKPVTNRDFSTALGKALGRPSFMPTPAFGLRIMLGEVAGLVTAGQRVLPRRALALGYQFAFPDIDSALRDVLK